MLVNDPIDDITWASVEEFCQGQIPEGATVDYKVDWPGHLENTIAAMANTLGGVLIIGVACDDQERPTLPIVGIEPSDRLELRVFDICQGAIFPPVVPEVKACLNPDQSRAVIVIRVPMSRLSHAVDKNTQVYVRTGNRNSHTELADLSKIEWLLSHRNNLEQQREILVARARKRFQPIMQNTATMRAGLANLGQRHLSRGWLEMYAIPTYPSREFISVTPQALRDLALNTVQVSRTQNSGGDFPFSLSAPMTRHIDGGYCAASVFDGPTVAAGYHEVSEHGLYYVRERVLREHPGRAELGVLWGNLLAIRMMMFAHGVENLYSVLAYRGPIELSFSLLGVDGNNDMRFIPSGFNLAQATQMSSWSPDEEIVISRSVNVIGLADEVTELITEVAQRMHIAFGAAGSEASIRREIAAVDQIVHPH